LRDARLLDVNELSVNYLKTRSEATFQSLINVLAQDNIAAAH
jgi:hypothetical protein